MSIFVKLRNAVGNTLLSLIDSIVMLIYRAAVEGTRVDDEVKASLAVIVLWQKYLEKLTGRTDTAIDDTILEKTIAVARQALGEEDFARLVALQAQPGSEE